MFLYRKLTYFYLIVALLLASCNISKNVPKGKYLLKRNKLTLNYSSLDTTLGSSLSLDLSNLIKETNITKEELVILLRPQPNYRTIGIRAKLRVYNLIDSAVVAENRAKKLKKIELKNQKLKEKEARINEKRLKKLLTKALNITLKKLLIRLHQN